MKSLLILACLLFCSISYGQTVKIPDKNFEKALIELEIDSDATINGLILKSDAQKVTFLDVSGKKIRNLKGIEAFTSLVYLNCKNNRLCNLNISQNISLTNLYSDVNNVRTPNNNFASSNWFDY